MQSRKLQNHGMVRGTTDRIGRQVCKRSGNIKVLKRIRELLVSISETPFEGIGKPEPLKFIQTGNACYTPHRISWGIEFQVAGYKLTKGLPTLV